MKNAHDKYIQYTYIKFSQFKPKYPKKTPKQEYTKPIQKFTKWGK